LEQSIKDRSRTKAMIRKEGRQFVLFSKDGNRRLGTFKTRAEAEARERKILAVKTLRRSQ
jgi:hypothetical protein